MGQGINRIDAIAKVTGEARYSGEYPLDGMIYGWVV
ncbi:MAG: hypothetical protein JWN47_2586, partial [Frankiales bacterium]|nr:hypothetical protein [Frankiales bacterium]